MKLFFTYMQLEIKRIFKLFPRICIITCLLICTALLFRAGYAAGKKPEVQKINIGVAADGEDLEYLEMGIYVLQHMESTKEICHFEIVEADEGMQKLEDKRLDALFLFPKSYVRSVYYGVEEPIELRFGTAQTGISSLLLRQLADTVSNLMIDSKAGVYAMQDMYEGWGIKYKTDADELTGHYMLKILDRQKIFETQKGDMLEGMTVPVYYGCAAFVLLFLMWGLCCGSIFGEQNPVLEQLLVRNGLSKGKQLVARYLALLLFFLTNYGLLSAVFLSFAGHEYLGAVCKFSCVWLLICVLIFMIYGITRDAIGGTMFGFLTISILAFFSGFFYPLTYFPEWMQKVAEILPTRVLFRYGVACVTGVGEGRELILLLVYTAMGWLCMRGKKT